MQASESGSEPAISERQELTSHSASAGLEGAGTTDLDALLGDHPMDPHFKRQLEQLDHLDLSHIENDATREKSPSTSPNHSEIVRNPLAPPGAPVSSAAPSRSATPTQSLKPSTISNHMLLENHDAVIGEGNATRILGSASRSGSAAPSSGSAPQPFLGSPARVGNDQSRKSSPHIADETIQSSRQGSVAPTEDEMSAHASPANDSAGVSKNSAASTATNTAATTPFSSALDGGNQAVSSTILATTSESQDDAAQKNGKSEQEALPPQTSMDDNSSNRVSAYARLDFDSFTFYVQTLQVVLGRRSEHGGPSTDVDVHLGPAKAISRRHAKIFYNFATQRFELTVIGRNGAFVGDVFVETGSTVPLRDSTKVQIGQIAFNFVLPIQGKREGHEDSDAERDVDEELEVEDVGNHHAYNRSTSNSSTPREKDASNLSQAGSRGSAGPSLGNEKSHGGKLKQRSESIKRDGPEEQRHHSDPLAEAQEGTLGLGTVAQNADHADHSLNSSHRSSASSLASSRKASVSSDRTRQASQVSSGTRVGSPATSTTGVGTASGNSGAAGGANSTNLSTDTSQGANNVQRLQHEQHQSLQSHGTTDPSLANVDPSLDDNSGLARNKPRQASFLKRAEENNLFAHVPPDQLAAVNAQVDAAIAGLPDIPGFDTPAMGGGATTPGGSDVSNNPLLNQRFDGANLSQLLGLQTQLGLQQQAPTNLGNLNGLMNSGAGAGLSGFQGLQDQNNVNNAGLQSLQQLQALQNLQGLDGLQGLAGLHGIQGLQPAAGLGLLQQLQALQRNKLASAQGSQQPQTRQKRKPKREYRPEEIPEQYRTKPAHSYSHLITAALRDRLSNMPDGTQGGLSLGDIYEAIMDLFPYYRYCPPGWQNSVRHNLSSSKSFRKVSKEGKGWLWGLDEEYLAEKEKQRQRALQRQQQQALAQQQAMAEQHAREQAREQSRLLQLQRDREREAEQRRFLEERAARAAQVGVPLHQLSATLGTSNIPGFGDLGSFSNSGSSGSSDGSLRNHSSNSIGDRAGSQAPKPAVLPPETVKLLAGLQQHVQQELAKDGQPPLNPQLLSNALAVVIAQTAKQSGGLASLGTVLQQPGAVQKLLNQAMQLLRSTQRVPPSVPKSPSSTSTALSSSTTAPAFPVHDFGPAHSTSITSGRTDSTLQPPLLPAQPASSNASTDANANSSASSNANANTAASPSTFSSNVTEAPTSNASHSESALPTSGQIQAQPQIQPSARIEEHLQSQPATQKAQPHVLQPPKLQIPSQAELKEEPKPVPPGTPVATIQGDKSAPAGKKEESAEIKPSTNEAAAGTPAQAGNDKQPAAQSQQNPKAKSESSTGTKKQQPSLEKITEILAKAEAIPNPTPEVKGMIEKLKSHKRQLELKRSADSRSATQSPASKRQAVDRS